MVDIIIVGAGPAGMTAALYAARAGKTVTVLEKDAIGGQIVYSPMVDNYPAAPHLSGAEFAESLSSQIDELGVAVETAEVMGVSVQNGGFALATDAGERTCKALVLATGVKHRRLGLSGEDELVGMGVSYCAICDGAFYRGRRVAVVGGGDTALQDALFLANGCERVALIHRRDEFRAEKRLIEQLRARDNIDLFMSHTVTALRQAGGELNGLELRNEKSGEVRELKADGLFVAVGQEPQSAAFDALALTDAEGYFKAHEDAQSAVAGLFVAGDCRAKGVRQLATAIGDGAVAGLVASRYVDANR